MSNIEQQIEDLRFDIEELNKLIEGASRTRVKDLLGLDKRKLETELIQKQEKLNKSKEEPVIASGTVVKQKTGTYTVTLKSYAWDQSDKFVKIYVTLNGVQSIPKEQVNCSFTERSFKLRVDNLDGKNHELLMNNLLEKILPKESYSKVKTDTVLLMLRKDSQKNWACLTQRENKEKEIKKPKIDETADPNDSLMSMMKQMYEDGDDEMKRTLAKAWSESRNKQSEI